MVSMGAVESESDSDVIEYTVEQTDSDNASETDSSATNHGNDSDTGSEAEDGGIHRRGRERDLDSLDADPSVLVQQLLAQSRMRLQRQQSMQSIQSSPSSRAPTLTHSASVQSFDAVSLDQHSTLVQNETSLSTDTGSLSLDLDNLKLYEQLALSLAQSNSRRASRSKSVKRVTARSKSRVAQKRKFKQVDLATIFYGVAVFLLQCLPVIYKTAKLIANKVVTSSWFQATIQPKLDAYVILPVLRKRDACMKWMIGFKESLLQLTWADVRDFLISTWTWIKETYAFYKNFDYKAYFTPAPKPPPPPAPPGKPFSEILAEFKQDCRDRFEHFKKSRFYTLIASCAAFCVKWSSLGFAVVWKMTAPLRTSVFMKRVLHLFQTVMKAVFSGVMVLARLEKVQNLIAIVTKNINSIVDGCLQLIFGVTPLALIAYSVLLSHAKPRLDETVLQSYASFPHANATEMESFVRQGMVVHGILYSVFTAVYAIIVVWVYLPLLKPSSKKISSSSDSCYSYLCRNNISTPFPQICYSHSHRSPPSRTQAPTSWPEKVNTIINHSPTRAQSIVTAFLCFIVASSITVFQTNTVGHAETISQTITMAEQWVVYAGPVEEHQKRESHLIQSYQKLANTATPAEQLSQQLQPRVCELEIQVGYDRISNANEGVVLCKRRSMAGCVCPVYEVFAHCSLVKRRGSHLGENQADPIEAVDAESKRSGQGVEIWTISLECNSIAKESSMNHWNKVARVYRGDKNGGLWERLRLRQRVDGVVNWMDAAWYPTPVTVVEHVPSVGPFLLPDPVHIGPRYSSMVVQFSAPVLGGDSVAGNGGAGKKGEKVADLPVPQLAATMDRLDGTVVEILISAVARLSATEFRVSLNSSLILQNAPGKLNVRVFRTEATVGCREMHSPGRGCDVVKSVQVPINRGFIGASVIQQNIDSLHSRGSDWFKFVVEFDESVGIFQPQSAAGADLMRYVRDIQGWDLQVMYGGYPVVLDAFQEEVKGQRFSFDVVLPWSAGKNGALEFGVRSKFKSGIAMLGKAWPLLNVQSNWTSIQTERGICCASTIGIPVLHSSHCKPGYKFMAANNCAKNLQTIQFQQSVSSHPIANKAQRFMGVYVSESATASGFLSENVTCPPTFTLQTVSTPPLNFTQLNPGLYTITQTCLQASPSAKQPHGEATNPEKSLTRYCHVKHSPPALHIISAAWINSTSPQVVVAFNFSASGSVGGLKNSTIPSSAFTIRLSRQGSDLGAAVIVNGGPVFDGVEWQVTVGLANVDTQLMEGDSVSMSVRSVSTDSTSNEGSSGWFTWGSTVKRHAAWDCLDATPPYGACLDTTESVTSSKSQPIEGLQLAGFFIGGASGSSVILHVNFGARVSPRFSSLLPGDFFVGLGKNVSALPESSTESLLPVKVLEILDFSENNGGTVAIVANLTDHDLKYKFRGQFLYVAVKERSLVSIGISEPQGKSRTYVTAEAFGISVQKLLMNAPKTTRQVATKTDSKNSPTTTPSAEHQPEPASLIGALIEAITTLVYRIIMLCFTAVAAAGGFIFIGIKHWNAIDFALPELSLY
ncbi:hypothetical protein HDU78_000304 [Chytriomyces hyalinus]|nr:hypothetical protein HDU78_000304 [Chytriomyces hyalinus]